MAGLNYTIDGVMELGEFTPAADAHMQRLALQANHRGIFENNVSVDGVLPHKHETGPSKIR